MTVIASIRARLALWHTAVLAILLVLFASGAYGFVVHSAHARTDGALRDAVADLSSELTAERRYQSTTRAAADEVLPEMRFRTIAFVVYDTGGRVVAASIPRPPRPAPGEDSTPAFDARALGRIVAGRTPARRSLVAIADAEGGYRAALNPLHMRDGTFIAAAATSVHDEAETLAEARLAMWIAIPATLVLSLAGGWLLARRSLEPMVTMRAHAARISASNLGERLPIPTPGDEVGQLASVFNALLGRLEAAFTQQRQFMADASHELRTPVAVVQSESSRALARADRPAAEYVEALEIVRAAARRLRRIVDDLFLLARADAGELPVQHDPLYLDEVVAQCVREMQSLAEARGVVIRVESLPEVAYAGDELLLQRLLLNLLDNAVRYSHSGATVGVRLTVHPDAVGLAVEDSGPGIPSELQPRIFDRFVRADASRGHGDDTTTSGAGLGLSIARWIAEAHGGTLELLRSGPTGTVFVLRLPLPAVGPRAS